MTDRREDGEIGAEEGRTAMDPVPVKAQPGRAEGADRSKRSAEGPARPPRRPPTGDLRRPDPTEPTTVEESDR
jgi:hypothetical protein